MADPGLKEVSELGLTVDTVKYPKLRDEHLKISDEYRSQQQSYKIDGFAAITVVHEPTGIAVDADSRETLKENWEIAQISLSAALEHKESIGTGQPPHGGHL